MINYDYMCFKNTVKKNPIPFMQSIAKMVFWDWLNEETSKLMITHGMSQYEALYCIVKNCR